MQIKDRVLQAFHEDHALLGAALYALRTELAGKDCLAARSTADRIDVEAGAHIAFEEYTFYPMLGPYLSDEEVKAMYHEHRDGLALIREIAAASDLELADPDFVKHLMTRVESLQEHVAECGDLFGAMGALSNEQYKDLLTSLEKWRKLSPRWSEIVHASRSAVVGR